MATSQGSAGQAVKAISPHDRREAQYMPLPSNPHFCGDDHAAHDDLRWAAAGLGRCGRSDTEAAAGHSKPVANMTGP
eukprot:scaffold7759_cov471-Prasinococcus_capsulatus_cf.AAC.1